MDSAAPAPENPPDPAGLAARHRRGATASDRGERAPPTEPSRLEQRLEELEGSIARRVANVGGARRSLAVTPADIQRSLPRGAALVEYVRYRHYLGSNRFETRYGAVVVDRERPPAWVPLGSASEIDGQILACQSLLRGRASVGDPVLATGLKDLHQRIWSPITRKLAPSIRAVVVAPDGALGAVSFGMLLDPRGDFLAEHLRIHYITTGRDLVASSAPTPSRPARPDLMAPPAASSAPTPSHPPRPDPVASCAPHRLRPARPDFVIFASPEFRLHSPLAAACPSANPRATPTVTPCAPPSASPSAAPSSRRASAATYSDLEFPPLPGTACEAEALARLATESGMRVVTFAGAEATKARLRSTWRPRWLHVATHGFFLGDSHVEDPWREPPRNRYSAWTLHSPANPMLRSGLALAGAQDTVLCLRRGEAPPASVDGIVTALDVGALDLQGTELVVLSACDAGVGGVRAGEGVLGLKRGFLQAGAQNLLLSLWPVDDEAAGPFMADFYSRLLRGLPPAEALAEVQREHLIRIRRERGLVTAVRVAGPFVLNARGPVPLSPRPTSP